ncbi:MAG: enoyl-CoA hydratase/isomerase family protein [Chloroflexi bacterium]|nr:enoyl-CoA hydratase/isomerase family protein [Chloroflexota bacterium]
MVQTAVSTQPVLLKEYEDGIFVARMNRLERLNALGGGLPEALNEAWFEFRDNAKLKVMIITGVGDRAFGVGADLRAFSDRAREMGATSAAQVMEAMRRPEIGPSITSNNLHLYKPVIAAINGWCLAGSCEMAMGCDFRIIEEHAQIGLPEVKRGMGAKNTTHKLFYLSFLSMGFEIDWTGDPLTAERAVELGFANEIVPKGKSLERAKEIARQMIEKPLAFHTYHKERFFKSIGTPVRYALAMEQRFPPQEDPEYRKGLEASLKAGLPGWPVR